MFIEQILTQARERLAVLDSDATVKDAAALMARPHTDLVVVCRDKVVAGIVTKTDIVAHVSRSPASGFATRLDTIMTREVAFCRASDPLAEVWSMMKERGFKRIPVVDASHVPIGITASRDVLQGLLREVEIEDALLRDYIFGVGYH